MRSKQEIMKNRAKTFVTRKLDFSAGKVLDYIF